MIAYSIAPAQVEPAPAVQPKQCSPVAMGRFSSSSGVMSQRLRGLPWRSCRPSIWLKSRAAWEDRADEGRSDDRALTAADSAFDPFRLQPCLDGGSFLPLALRTIVYL